MVDSFGKVEAGLEDGNYAWFGSFQECESATDYLRPWNDDMNFTSEYCTMVMVMYFCYSVSPLPVFRQYYTGPKRTS